MKAPTWMPPDRREETRAIEKVVQAAYEEGHRAGRHAGYQQGYLDGFGEACTRGERCDRRKPVEPGEREGAR